MTFSFRNVFPTARSLIPPTSSSARLTLHFHTSTLQSANGKGEEEQDKKSPFKQTPHPHFCSYFTGKNVCAELHTVVNVRMRKLVHGCATMCPERRRNWILKENYKTARVLPSEDTTYLSTLFFQQTELILSPKGTTQGSLLWPHPIPSPESEANGQSKPYINL